MAVAEDIAAGIETLLADVDATPVRVRKFPGWLDGDPAPVVVVSVARHGATKASFDADFVEYQATVSRVEKSQGRAADSADALEWQEAARAKLHDYRLLGVSAVVTGDMDPNPPFDREAAGTGKNVTSLLVRYTTHEARG